MRLPARWRPTPRRFIRLIAGLWLFGTGEALVLQSTLGNSPWTVLAEGLGKVTPMTVGVATQAISVLVLLAWVPLRESPGLGTVCNAFLVGFAMDVMLPLLPDLTGSGERGALLGLGVGVVGIGSGLYINADLGSGPRDGLMTGLHRRLGVARWRVRALLESVALVSGWLLGGTVGVGTIAFALLIGPAVDAALRLMPGARPAGAGPGRRARARLACSPQVCHARLQAGDEVTEARGCAGGETAMTEPRESSEPYVDVEEQINWIHQRTGVDRGTVATVLDIEFEYQVATGIADAPGYAFRFYPSGIIEGESGIVDLGRIAHDAERLAGIGRETAHQVLVAESRYLEMRGLT